MTTRDEVFSTIFTTRDEIHGGRVSLHSALSDFSVNSRPEMRESRVWCIYLNNQGLARLFWKFRLKNVIVG